MLENQMEYIFILLFRRIRLVLAPPNSSRARLLRRLLNISFLFIRRIDLKAGGAGFDASKSTILVVSHEASQTGAPILSLNLVQNLQKKYNVISFLLGDGL